MTHFEKRAEAIDIVRRLRDGHLNNDELDAILNRLSELFVERDINLLHVPEDAGSSVAEIVARETADCRHLWTLGAARR